MSRVPTMEELIDVQGIPGLPAELPEGTELEPFVLHQVASNPDQRKDDLDADYTSARETMHFQKQMMMEAAKIALESLRSSDSPRAIETFSALMGQITNLNKESLRVHKEMNDIISAATPDAQGGGNGMASSGGTIQAENVFIGTPAELMDQVGSRQDMIRKEMKSDDDEDDFIEGEVEEHGSEQHSVEEAPDVGGADSEEVCNKDD